MIPIMKMRTRTGEKRNRPTPVKARVGRRRQSSYLSKECGLQESLVEFSISARMEITGFPGVFSSLSEADHGEG